MDHGAGLLKVSYCNIIQNNIFLSFGNEDDFLQTLQSTVLHFYMKNSNLKNTLILIDPRTFYVELRNRYK